MSPIYLVLTSLLVAHQISKETVSFNYDGKVKLRFTAPMQIGKWKLQLVPTRRPEESYGVRYICDKLLHDGDNSYATFSFNRRTDQATTGTDWNVALRFISVGKPRNCVIGVYKAIGGHLQVSGTIVYTGEPDRTTIDQLTRFTQQVTKSLLPPSKTAPYFGS